MKLTVMSNNKKSALAMADRLDFLAIGLENVGLANEANINRTKANEIRLAQAKKE